MLMRKISRFRLGDKLDKKVVQAVLERSGGLCEVCSSAYLVELHHIIYGSGKRKQHENEHSVIALCWYCHKGTNGVHGKNGKELDLYLKRKLQEKYFSMGYSEDEVRELMGGKLY